VTHDRGNGARRFYRGEHPESVMRYGRGEQHLYHFNPLWRRRATIFMNAPWTGIMEDPTLRRVGLHMDHQAAHLGCGDARVIQESRIGIVRAVPRYFNSSSFRAEWLTRRNRLLKAWTARC